MIRRVVALAAASGAVAAMAVVVVPQHAASALALAGAAVVVVLAVSALVLAGPLVEREVPVTELDVGDAPGAPTLEPAGLRDARRDLTLPGGRPVPRPVWERLAVAAVLRLQERGIDIDSPRTRHQGEAMLSRETWALLTTPPAPDRSRPGSPPPGTVAAVVHRTLDELDRLTGAPGHPIGGSHGDR